MQVSIQEYFRRAAEINRRLYGHVSDDQVARAIKAIPRHYAANRVENDARDATSIGRSVQVWRKFKFNQVIENRDCGNFVGEDFLAWSGQPGSSGNIVRIASTISPSAVGSSTCASQTFAFAGTLTSDLPVNVQKPTFQAGLAIDTNILIGTANSLSLNFINPTASAITPTSSQSYVLSVLRRGGFFTGSGGVGWKTQEGAATAGSILALTSDMPVGPGSISTALGTVRMTTGAVAHQSVCMEMAGGQWGVGGSSTATVPTAGVLPRMHFEARVRFAQTTVQSAFIGMATPGQSASQNTMFDSSDAWVPVASLGFRINGATSTSAINAGYGTTTAWSTIASGTCPTTAANFTKLGFVIDPYDPLPVQMYQDGTLIASSTFAALTAANWPSDVALTPTFYLQAQGSGGASVTMDPDWVYAGEMLGVE